MVLDRYIVMLMPQKNTNMKYNKVYSEQKFLTRSIKKPTGGHKSPYQKVIADCAVTEHANLQDATRQIATPRGRRYLKISQ